MVERGPRFQAPRGGPGSPEERYVSVATVAATYDMTEAAVRQAHLRGDLVGYHVGNGKRGRLRFRWSDVMAWAHKRTRPA